MLLKGKQSLQSAADSFHSALVHKGLLLSDAPWKYLQSSTEWISGLMAGEKVFRLPATEQSYMQWSWHIASLSVHTVKHLTNVQQAQCLRSTSNTLQIGREVKCTMHTLYCPPPLPAQLKEPLRKVHTCMENCGQNILITTLLVLFPKHPSNQAAGRHKFKWTGKLGPLLNTSVRNSVILFQKK